MSLDGIAYRLTDDQPESRATVDELRIGSACLPRPVVGVHDKITPPYPLTAAHRPGELGVVTQPIRLR